MSSHLDNTRDNRLRSFRTDADKENVAWSETKKSLNTKENDANLLGKVMDMRAGNSKRIRRRKTILRTKSSNSILSKGSRLSTAKTRPDLVESFKNSITKEPSNYNKARRVIDVLNENKENVNIQKLKVARNSPEVNRTARKHSKGQPLRELPIRAPVITKKVEDSEDDDDDDIDDEIEIVSHEKPADEVPDGYQPMPEDLLNFVFSGDRHGISKKTLDDFKDPLELDLSNIKQNKSLDIDLTHDSDSEEEQVGDSSGIGTDLKLEFPEPGEETEEKKLAKIKEYYEGNRKNFKPRRL